MNPHQSNTPTPSCHSCPPILPDESAWPLQLPVVSHEPGELVLAKTQLRSTHQLHQTQVSLMHPPGIYLCFALHVLDSTLQYYSIFFVSWPFALCLLNLRSVDVFHPLSSL